MGDLMHALPALTDAGRALPGISFDWAVDENFAAVPSWHPLVRHVIPIAHRRWQTEGGSVAEWKHGYRQLNEHPYDAVIDVQGNLKSALITFLRRGPAHGLDRLSCREQPAFLAYRKCHRVPRGQHAIERHRQLLAQALGYPSPTTSADYGVQLPHTVPEPLPELPQNYLIFIHNASWPTKLWPIAYWHQLVVCADQNDLSVLLPCGSITEQEQARAIAKDMPNAQVLPLRLPLDTMAMLIGKAVGAIGSDTGFTHLAAMAGTPTVTLYGPTQPQLIGTVGHHQRHMLSTLDCQRCRRTECRHGSEKTPACMAELRPDQVWQTLQQCLAESKRDI